MRNISMGEVENLINPIKNTNKLYYYKLQQL